MLKLRMRDPRPVELLDPDTARVETAIRRGLQVLGALKRSDESVGNTDLAERTGLTKPTVSRITYTLARHGYLSFDARTRGYRPGPRAAALGSAGLAAMKIRSIALPRMRQMADGAAFNVCLGVRDRSWMVYTDVCHGSSLVGVRVFPGSRIPLLNSAIGRAYIAGLDVPQRDKVLGSLPERLCTADARTGLSGAITDFRERGYCTSVGEWNSQINGAAAPVRSPDGQVFAINLGGPAYKVPVERLKQVLGPALATLARDIEAELNVSGI